MTARPRKTYGCDPVALVLDLSGAREGFAERWRRAGALEAGGGGWRPKSHYTARDLARLLGLTPGEAAVVMGAHLFPTAPAPKRTYLRVAHADLAAWLATVPAYAGALERVRAAERRARGRRDA